MENRQAELEGTVEHIVFRNEENGYTVFILEAQTEAGEDEITCTGHLPDITPGEGLKVFGSWVNNQKYGLQLAVARSEKKTPSTAKRWKSTWPAAL